jgi:hypothetical protein
LMDSLAAVMMFLEVPQAPESDALGVG